MAFTIHNPKYLGLTTKTKEAIVALEMVLSYSTVDEALSKKIQDVIDRLVQADKIAGTQMG